MSPYFNSVCIIVIPYIMRGCFNGQHLKIMNQFRDVCCIFTIYTSVETKKEMILTNNTEESRKQVETHKIWIVTVNRNSCKPLRRRLCKYSNVLHEVYLRWVDYHSVWDM